MALKESFLWSSPPQNVYLLPQRPNLCLKHCPRPEQIDDRPTNKSAKIPHPTTGLPDSRSTASWTRFATGTGPNGPELRYLRPEKRNHADHVTPPPSCSVPTGRAPSR